MKYDYIGTFTNKKFHFMNPSVEEVCIEDIAQALSMNCRYSGHVKKFYSVAEHCCLIADYVISTTGCVETAYDALLHDASEAYLTDVPRPIKPHLINYMDIEKKAELVIQQALGCRPMGELIKYIDTHVCGTEARQLFLNIPEWCNDFDHIDITVQNWSPERAFSEFMARFRALKPSVETAA